MIQYGNIMNGSELFGRVVSTVQETNLKIGDVSGSISLYYPYEGDFTVLRDEFKEASKDFPGMTIEQLSQRIRIVVPEEDSRRLSDMPVKGAIRNVIELTGKHIPFDSFRTEILKRHPDARLVESPYQGFDWILWFPEEMDGDIYCLTVEMGQVTYHRYSPEEFRQFGFTVPE